MLQQHEPFRHESVEVKIVHRKKRKMNYKNISRNKAVHVQNVQGYNLSMQKALIDKVFFLDKVDGAEVFADYGCADGSILKFASGILPNGTFIGYDMSREMVDAANANDIWATDDLKKFQKQVENEKIKGEIVCLSLLSLIHEVYSYGPGEVKEFWNLVLNSGLFDYVAIRDMCVSRTTSRPSDSISVAKIRMLYDKDMLAQWEATWGSIDENWSLVHFLLTYRYVDSWDREFKENYLPLSLENLLDLITPDWEPTYIEHFTLPFIRHQVKEDFGIDLQDRTHLKLILKAK